MFEEMNSSSSLKDTLLLSLSKNKVDDKNINFINNVCRMKNITKFELLTQLMSNEEYLDVLDGCLNFSATLNTYTV